MQTGLRLRARAGWLFRRLTARWRLLPDFIIIGAQKAGTTSLYSYLCEHPNVEAALEKEIHFFDNNYHRGIGWYRSHFPLGRPSGHAGRYLVAGEATPYYMFHPLAPERVASTLPRVKLIALLRNPVDRAYSHYHHSVRGKVETLPFEEALARESDRLNGESQKLWDNPKYFSPDHQSYSYLSRGIYVDQLAAWTSLFPREQMLVLRCEDLYSDPRAVVRRVVKFLGLPEWEPGEFRTWNGARNPKLAPGTRQRLAKFFRPHNERLYEYLGVDLGWED